jgi:hypothetical protein
MKYLRFYQGNEFSNLGFSATAEFTALFLSNFFELRFVFDFKNEIWKAKIASTTTSNRRHQSFISIKSCESG